jgi:hypothetical protein
MPTHLPRESFCLIMATGHASFTRCWHPCHNIDASNFWDSAQRCNESFSKYCSNCTVIPIFEAKH